MFMYDIAGIRMEIISDFIYIHEIFKEFSSPSCSECHLIVDIIGLDIIKGPKEVFAGNSYYSWAYSVEEDGMISCFHQSDNGEILCRMDIDSAWHHGKISYNSNYENDLCLLIKLMLEILFRYKLVSQQGLVIHAAGLNWQEKGILLSAPSGTGKSTQADLWKRFKNARVLNGDHTAVRIIDNTPVVFGSPWSGSSPDFYNGKVDLSTIIILQQAGENSIRRLSRSETAAMLLPRCFLPSFSEEMMDMAVDTFDTLINKVPVYLLACRPEKEAVDLVCSFADELNANENDL